MPAATAFSIDGPSADGVRDRDDQAGRLLVDGGVDQLAHRHHVECFRRAIIDLDVQIRPPAWVTPFLTTDQNGSDAWPWLTTMIRLVCATAGTALATARRGGGDQARDEWLHDHPPCAGPSPLSLRSGVAGTVTRLADDCGLRTGKSGDRSNGKSIGPDRIRPVV